MIISHGLYRIPTLINRSPDNNYIADIKIGKVATVNNATSILNRDTTPPVCCAGAVLTEGEPEETKE
jgi:hypothetical protein